jgi:uncharacterized protein YdiU (UPF0061 family)
VTALQAQTTLPATLLAAVPLQPLPDAHWLAYNAELATELGLPPEPDASLLALLAGNAEPGHGARVASVYGGHQFGHWAGQLGDGRALLLGHINGQEVQLKGAGRTPFSRGADGRAVLRSSIREYLCSEAMHGLGIASTRALALVGSPQTVRRERIETAAVVTRVASSFVRFGHFEWLDASDDRAQLEALAQAVIAAHYPGATVAEFLGAVVERTAEMIAHWQTVGFCHGVMNTDNFSILGLTLDYGPFGFIDGFNAQHLCNHSDDSGRYAYDQQPQIGHWNCLRLLNACLPLLADEREQAVAIAEQTLARYAPAYARCVLGRWRSKLGLVTAQDDDPALINRFLTLLHQTRADFTLSFRALSSAQRVGGEAALRAHFLDASGIDAWLIDYRARLSVEPEHDTERAARMEAVNPLYVLRNHHAQAVIEAAEAGEFTAIDTLRRVLAQPFTEQASAARWAQPPPPGLDAPAVSCSS